MLEVHFLISNTVENQISIGMLKAMMPIEQSMANRDFQSTLIHQFDYLIKLSIENINISNSLIQIDITYLFEVGTFRGFMSFLLNSANQSSHGAAAYECGPVKRTGILRAYSRSIEDLLV